MIQKIQQRKLTVSGRVIRGDGYGKKLGFPTANIDRREYTKKGLKVKLGVYAGTVLILHTTRHTPHIQLYKAGIVIGPKDKNNLPKIEAHLIGFEGSLYGKKIELELVKYIRPWKSFPSEYELKKQITKDISTITNEKQV